VGSNFSPMVHGAEIPPKHVSILPIVAGIITALLLGALAVFVWLSCRRKKRAWRFPDPTQELDGKKE
jgi:hypothetical protein